MSRRPVVRRVRGRRLLLRVLAGLGVLLIAGLALAEPASARFTPPKRPHPHRKPWPVTISVQTVPVLFGLPVQLDGITAKTDAKGVATFTQEHNFATHTLKLPVTQVSTPTRRFSFVRWAGQRDPNQAFRPEVTGLPMRANYTVTAAFAVEFPVHPTLLAPDGKPLDLDGVDEVSVRADTGEIIKLDPEVTTWLPGEVPVYRNSSVRLQVATYTLHRVMVSGANVVDVGQQSFQPAREKPVEFTTKFYDLRIQARDAIFKNPTGQRASVTYPNGTVHEVTLGPDHTATLTGLPRGVYVVRLVGAGTALPTQVTLSRDATADLVAVTRKDLVTLAVAALVLAIGLLFLGRGRRRVRGLAGILRHRTRRGEPGTDAPAPELLDLTETASRETDVVV